MALLCDHLPAVPMLAMRIPIPGDEDAHDEQVPAQSNDAPQVGARHAAPGSFTAPRRMIGIAEADPNEHAAAVVFAATNQIEQATRTAPAPPPSNEITTDAKKAPTPSADSARSSGDSTSRNVVRLHPSSDIEDHPPMPIATQPAPAANDEADDSSPAPAVENSERHQAAAGLTRDVRSLRSAAHAHMPQGPLVRSEVASVASSIDKPAEVVRASVDAGPAPAAPAQDAPGVAREAPVARPASSDPVARRVEPTLPGLPFSTTRDDRESSSRGEDAREDARGRHASAMSARLAAAVASTAETASGRAAAPSPVFVIPSLAPATPQPVAAMPEALAASAPALPPENVERLVQAMHVNVRSGVMEATVRLRPEYLGEVTIQLRVEGTSVTAVVQTEVAGVRQWLESQEQAIRNGLAAHGLDLDRLVINPDGEQQQARDDSEANESRRRAYRRRQQSTERFEITV
jgi:flagellar hook-length control protein FliK